MQQIDIYTRTLKLQGSNISKITNNYQKVNSKRNNTLVTQSGIENMLTSVREQVHFTFTNQHFLNYSLDMLYVQTDSDYDFTYNIKLEKYTTSFRYTENSLDEVKTNICYLAANTIDENCDEYHVAMKGDAGEAIEVVINETKTSTQYPYPEYVSSIKVKTVSGDPFLHDTLITFGGYFFCLVSAPTQDANIIILKNKEELYSDPECGDESLVNPEKSYYPEGWKYTNEVYYRIISKNSGVSEIVYEFVSDTLRPSEFNDWLKNKTITTTSLEPMEILVSESCLSNKIYVSKDIKDINFKITKSLELYYPKPRLLNITIYGESETDKADAKLYIDETYEEANLERKSSIATVSTINVNEIHLTGKFFDSNYVSNARVGDFGNWENVKCNKLILHSIGQVTTEAAIRNILMINSTNIPVIEFKDSI